MGYPVAFKRVPLLFKVFRRVTDAEPNARLVLIGDMSKSPQDLPALARDEGIADSRDLWTDPIAHDELPLYYALGDVYVHTSAYEGVPRVLFEASAAGLPLVAMNVGRRRRSDRGWRQRLSRARWRRRGDGGADRRPAARSSAGADTGRGGAADWRSSATTPTTTPKRGCGSGSRRFDWG